MFDRSTTVRAWLPRSTVDQQFQTEVLKVLGTCTGIKQGSALVDGSPQDGLYRFGQQFVSDQGDTPGRSRGVDARHKKRFVGVDVADSSHDALVQEKLSYRRLTAAASLVEVGTVKGLIKGFRPVVCEQRMSVRVILGPDDQPETAIIIETQIRPVV